MCHLLLFWTEVEDTHFLPSPREERRIFSFSSGLYLRMYIFQALHLLLEFRIYNANLDLDTTLSELCTISIFIFKSAAVFVLFTN